MILPNLAARPFLNTRPVLLVTGAAGLLAVLFLILNVSFYFSSNRTLAPQLERARELRAQRDALTTQVRGVLADLEKVPWRSLSSRVQATNLVLREWSFSWLRLLDDIERVMPRDVRIVRIAPVVSSEGVALNLMAIARSRDDILELLENLIADGSFSEPIPVREALPEKSSIAGYELTLRVNYHPTGVDS
jgi:Tfp pilus assembly protein PilN